MDATTEQKAELKLFDTIHPDLSDYSQGIHKTSP